MAAEQPADSFWDLLRQSGLVPDEQVRALEAELGGAGAKLQSSSAVADELTRRGVLTEWQADNLKRGKTRGFHLGPYRILRPLGQGGMSKVFLAEHEMMHRRCAIKILPNKYQEDSELLGRFHLEAEAIAKLDHPHIVRAYDFNKDVRYGKDIHYLVMEYIDGQDLRQMVEQHGPLDYRQAADFIRQAAEGLAHAHTAGLVHRDVKPANLLVDRNGVLKILDLGLARFTFEGEQAWQTSEGEQSAVGTADYVAPEQVMDSRSVTGRADIYSLGLTFYFLLTGRRPFPKSTLPELLMAHKMERPEPIGKLRPDVPTDLVDIIERMTAKQPFMRFQSAKDVAEALQTWLHESESGREYSRISALMAAAMAPNRPRPATLRRPSPHPPAARTSNWSSSTTSERLPATGRSQAVREQPQRDHQGRRGSRQDQRAKVLHQRQQRPPRGKIARPLGRQRDFSVVRSAAGRRHQSSQSSLRQPSAVQARRWRRHSEVALALDRSGGCDTRGVVGLGNLVGSRAAGRPRRPPFGQRKDRII